MRAVRMVLGSALVVLTAGMGVAGAEDAQQPEKEEAKVKVGDAAPDFELPKPGAPEGSKETIKLSELKGKKNVVLAFYPKVFTGGCTRQLCGYRDDIAKFEAEDALIVAISTDEQEQSDAFKKELQMPFVVMGDPEHRVIDAYGIPLRDYNGNKIAQRSIVVIDKEGIVQYIDLEYDISKDEEPLLQALAKLEDKAPAEEKKSS